MSDIIDNEKEIYARVLERASHIKFEGDPPTVMELREMYREGERQIKDIQEAQEALLENLQSRCSHDACIQVDFKPETIVSSAWPPSRMCIVCGLEEDGWGIGFDKLRRSKVVKDCGCNRDEFYSHRRLDFDLEQTFTIKEK